VAAVARQAVARTGGAQVWTYGYERAGQLVHEHGPDGLRTHRWYCGKRRLRQLEANGTSGRRKTLWGCREGRLTGVRVAPQGERPPEPEPHYAVSVVYSADVVDDQFNIVSRDPKAIGQILGHAVVKTPTNILGAHGLPKATRYNMDGKLAERIDESGMTLRYRYDPTGRLVKAAAMRYRNISGVLANPGGPRRRHSASADHRGDAVKGHAAWGARSYERSHRSLTSRTARRRAHSAASNSIKMVGGWSQRS